MGWYTYSKTETNEHWEFTYRVDKNIIIPRFRKVASVTRVVLYTGDVGTDCVTIYMLYYYASNYGFELIAWQLALVFMLLPIILTLIAVIIDMIRNPDYKTLSKILLVPAAIICCLGLPLYFLIRDAQDSFQPVPTRRHEEKSAQARLNEALLEALPQAMIQVFLIVVAAGHGEPVAAWQIITLTFSIVSFSFTLATSTYLFCTTWKTRLIFFACSLVTVTSRMLAGGWLLIPTAVLLLVSITVWLVKRLCPDCCCSCCCTCCVHGAPLAASHSQCDPHSLLHVPISWFVTAFANGYTASGLLLSTLTMLWSLFAVTMDQLASPGSPAAIYWITSAAFAVVTFLMNLVFVCVPKYRRKIGEAWLNINQDNGQAELY